MDGAIVLSFHPRRELPSGPKLERVASRDPEDDNSMSVSEPDLLHPERYSTDRKHPGQSSV